MGGELIPSVYTNEEAEFALISETESERRIEQRDRITIFWIEYLNCYIYVDRLISL
jgi:hypothetical protein